MLAFSSPLPVPLGRAPAPLRSRPSASPRRRPRATTAAASTPGPSAAALRTCRVCKQRYDPTANGPRSCRSHPENFSGDSARKMNWETDAASGIPSGALLRFYWCCGADDVDAPGCSIGPHRSYDD